jgi:hypothetical protein
MQKINQRQIYFIQELGDPFLYINMTVLAGGVLIIRFGPMNQSANY